MNVLLINPSYQGSYGGVKASIVNPINPILGLATIAGTAMQAGHKVKIIKDTAALLAALKSRKNLDLVMGEVEELRTLKEKLAAANPTTSIVPILVNKSREKLLQTRKEFSCVVSPSGGIKGLRQEINRAIKLKDKATKKKATEEKAPSA